MTQRDRFIDLCRHVRPPGIALVGLALLSGFLVMAVFAPAIAPHDPKTLFEPLLPPSSRHLLGTDDIGHDLFSELCYGARFSLSISLLSALLSTAFGAMLGLLAGYDKRSGYLVMRVVDVFLAVPRFPLIILMAAFYGPAQGRCFSFIVELTPLSHSCRRTIPASIVLPRPTSSASRRRAGYCSATRRATTRWWGQGESAQVAIPSSLAPTRCGASRTNCRSHRSSRRFSRYSFCTTPRMATSAGSSGSRRGALPGV